VRSRWNCLNWLDTSLRKSCKRKSDHLDVHL
jgi:hypothetical protein